jgi:hypothetical protein
MKRYMFIPLVSGLILLMALLSACGSNSTASSSTPSATTTPSTVATKTVAATPTMQGNGGSPSGVASTPTAQSNGGSSSGVASTPTGNCNGTYGCGVGSSNLTPYQGSGYTIDYPGSWVIKSDGSNGNIFSMPDDAASLHVFVQDGNNMLNPLQYEFGTLSKDNCKPVGSGTQSVQVSGQTWQQTQFVCMPGDNGQAGGKTEQVGILISTSLHNNKYYSMDYMADPATFNNTYQTFFKPMVSSFKLQ